MKIAKALDIRRKNDIIIMYRYCVLIDYYPDAERGKI